LSFGDLINGFKNSIALLHDGVYFEMHRQKGLEREMGDNDDKGRKLTKSIFLIPLKFPASMA